MIINDDLVNSKKYEKNSHILIHIINKSAMLNGVEYTLTFLKDVTFGVLYEQIKAQDHLKRMINKTLQQKIQMPLQTIVTTC